MADELTPEQDRRVTLALQIAHHRTRAAELQAELDELRPRQRQRMPERLVWTGGSFVPQYADVTSGPLPRSAANG